MTVEEFFRATQGDPAPVEATLENDLPDFFVRTGRGTRGFRPAWEMVRQHRTDLINKIEYWTGVRRSVVRSLVDCIAEAAERLQLHVDPKKELLALVELTTYATTLSMNFLTRGSFVPRVQRAKPGGRKAGPDRQREVIHGATPNRDHPRT